MYVCRGAQGYIVIDYFDQEVPLLSEGGEDGRAVDGPGRLPEPAGLQAAAEEGAAAPAAAAATGRAAAAHIILSASTLQRNLRQLNIVYCVQYTHGLLNPSMFSVQFTSVQYTVYIVASRAGCPVPRSVGF